MFENYLITIQNLVEAIHTTEQESVNDKFMEFINASEYLINGLAAQDIKLDMTEEMYTIQKYYEIKDMVELSDYLLYKLKPEILKIQKMMYV